jgi:hypothetical protein
MEKVYLKQQQKIANMTGTQTTDTINNNTKHTRGENYTNIQFTHNEIQLLNKGLKYNLHFKKVDRNIRPRSGDSNEQSPYK